ncbi:hypothetical protein ACPX19_00345 [Winogradskyella sp. HB-48]|uniref:hypothetical protein n=1 Tax=Winogradskyella sp. HB-48 TaxID=3416808 RepID=UPI003CEA67AB
MKKLVLILIFVLPIFAFAEYNGVHAKFKIELRSGHQITGYKYIANGNNTLQYKEQLENDPKSFLFNQFTYEPGEYGCYTERLEYPYEEKTLYKLTNPVEIKIDEIKTIEIIDLITASYAIQIVGDYNTSDQSWMKSTPIASYSDFEEMCTYDTFIHASDNISKEIRDKITQIIKDAESKIKEKETELDIQEESDGFDAKIQEIFKERNSKILELLKEHSQLKTVTVSICTC